MEKGHRFTLSTYYGTTGWQVLKELKVKECFRKYLIKRFGNTGCFNEVEFSANVMDVLNEKGSSLEFVIEGINYLIKHY